MIAFAPYSGAQSKRAPQPLPAQQQSTTDQRGTENWSVFVKALPARLNEEIVKADAPGHDQKREQDRDTLLLSGANDVIIFFQLLIFAMQAYLLWRTLKVTGIAAQAAKDAADALPVVEGAYVYPSIISINIADS